MRAWNIYCSVVVLALLAGCAQHIGAVVQASAPTGYAAQGETYVLIPQPGAAVSEAWQQSAELLRPALEALGYVPLNAAGASATVSPQGADASAQPPASAQAPVSPPTHGAGQSVAVSSQPRPAAAAAQKDSGTSAATAGAASGVVSDAVPQVAVFVYWDASEPIQEMELVYAPVRRRFPPRFYDHHFHGSLRSSSLWDDDDLRPYRVNRNYVYVPQDKYLRRLIVEAVTNSRPRPAVPSSAAQCLQWLPQEPDKLLWRTVVVSKGNLSRAESILPELVRAAVPWLGRAADATVSVSGEEVTILHVE